MGPKRRTGRVNTDIFNDPTLFNSSIGLDLAAKLRTLDGTKTRSCFSLLRWHDRLRNVSLLPIIT